MPEKKQPVYDERVNEILSALERGRTREELAVLYGYSTWKSLDIYMRRRNFIWDAKMKTYIPAHTRAEELLENYDTSAPTKVALIMSLFAKEGADPKAIAKQVGMRDHRELAEHMRIKGYECSTEDSNYVKRLGELTTGEPNDNDADEAKQVEQERPKLMMVSTHPREARTTSLEEYLPLLELLDKHKEQLMELLSVSSSTGRIPRFAVPGTTKTKSV